MVLQLDPMIYDSMNRKIDLHLFRSNIQLIDGVLIDLFYPLMIIPKIYQLKHAKERLEMFCLSFCLVQVPC